MLSTFPATTLSSDGFFSNLFPAFDGGFTPWDCIEPNFLFPHEMEEEPVVSPMKSPPPEPVISNSYSGSYDSKLNFVHSSSGSDEPNWNNDNNNLNGCLHGRKRKLTASNRDRDEKKRRRMISNRESARRSRFRKQKHLENLRNQANRLKVASRDLMNRLRLTTQQCQLVQCDNDRLRIESAILRQKLEAIRQILVARQLEQQFNSYSACACSNMEQNLNKYSVINHH